jgi:hypothetical protein
MVGHGAIYFIWEFYPIKNIHMYQFVEFPSLQSLHVFKGESHNIYKKWGSVPGWWFQRLGMRKGLESFTVHMQLFIQVPVLNQLFPAFHRSCFRWICSLCLRVPSPENKSMLSPRQRLESRGECGMEETWGPAIAESFTQFPDYFVLYLCLKVLAPQGFPQCLPCRDFVCSCLPLLALPQLPSIFSQ